MDNMVYILALKNMASLILYFTLSIIILLIDLGNNPVYNQQI